jgi:hypothetical protein
MGFSVWTYLGHPFVTAPPDMFGFVYLITNKISGKKYIGKKQFWSHTTKKIPGKRNKKHTVKESNWKDYWSSSEDIAEDLKVFGHENFSREILELFPSKRDLTFGEVEYQIKSDVLTAKLESGERAFYNRNIMSRWFVKSDKPLSDEARAKISVAQKGRVRTEEEKRKISETLKKHPEYMEPLRNYSASLTHEERVELGRYGQTFVDYNHPNIVENGKRVGHFFKENKLGLFGQTKEQILQNASNAGKIGGKMKWWNNGTECTRSNDCPGDGWVPGRIMKKRKITKGLYSKEVASSGCDRFGRQDLV